MYKVITVAIYLLSFVLSFYGLSSIRFEKFCDVKNPAKVQTLLFMLSFALAYFVSQFLLGFIIS